MEAFEQLIAAEQQPFSGWDFSYLRDRMREAAPSWDYAALVRGRLPAVQALLDLGTGGGEFLSALAPLPPRTVATEAYPLNVPIARMRLAPLSVEVLAVEGAPDNVDIALGSGIRSLPFPDADFPLIVDRHESYYPAEIARLLRRGGTFVTQQVGGRHFQALNALLGAPHSHSLAWDLGFAVRQLEAAGLEVADRREEFPATVFLDVGAVVYYLKAIPWQIPDFAVEAYRDRLALLHRRIEATGDLRIEAHYFYLEAVKR
jgi:SAM-dependent methyltransferase